MEKFYLTFGVQYPRVPHPYWPPANGKGWVLIEADDDEAARDLARQAFGLSWSHITSAKHFDEAQMRRRYYPLGQIGNLHQHHRTDVPLRFTVSEPGFYGLDTDLHIGNRVQGRLKEEYGPNREWYDLEYFHDKCLPAGYLMFENITEVDTNVLSGEMDWANRWTCPVCKVDLA